VEAKDEAARKKRLQNNLAGDPLWFLSDEEKVDRIKLKSLLSKLAAGSDRAY